MKYKYKISIAIPIHNTEKYVRDCIESVINQSLSEIEIILLDNGCTDGCPQILDEYANRYFPKVKVIHKEDKGYGQSLNVAMSVAEGEYFAFVESDDIIRPNMYAVLYDIAKKNGNIDVVKGDYSIFTTGPLNTLIIEDKSLCSSPQMYNHVIYPQEGFWKEVIQNAALYTWSGIYRIDFLKQNRILHNETPGASYQDNGFWFQTMISANTVYFVDQPFYMLRRDNPNSSINSKEKVYCIRDEYEFILDYINSRPDLYKNVIELYWWARFGAYRFSYRRIGEQYKLEFLLHFRETILYAINRGEVNKTLFSKIFWNQICKILDDPSRYNEQYIYRQLQNDDGKKNLIKRLKWCYEDNGLSYTVKKAFEKLFAKIVPNRTHKVPNNTRLLSIEKKMGAVLRNMEQMSADHQEILQAIRSKEEKDK